MAELAKSVSPLAAVLQDDEAQVRAGWIDAAGARQWRAAIQLESQLCVRQSATVAASELESVRCCHHRRVKEGLRACEWL